MPSRKTSFYYLPITKHSAKQKIKNSIQMQTWEQTSSLILRPIHITHLTCLLLPPPETPTNDPTSHLKHWSTIFPHEPPHPSQRMYHVPPLIPISFFMSSHNLLHYVFMNVSNRPQVSIFIISPTYTPSFITITYKSYNINTTQIANKNNHHNSPPITYTSQTDNAISYIYFLYLFP